MERRAKKIKKTESLPAVIKRPLKDKDTDLINFPLSSYSYSSFTKFSTNPFMFKVNNINGEYIDTTSTPANVLGKACHRAMKAFLGGDPDVPTPADIGEATKHAYNEGKKYLDAFSDGFIAWSKTIPNRAKLNEKFSFSFFGYLKVCTDYEKKAKEILIVERKIKHKVEVAGKVLPVALESIPDVVYRDLQNRIIIEDHKFTSKFSNEESIDGPKLLQAAFLYFTVFAETGEEPYAAEFPEFKTTQNKDKKVSQLKRLRMVYNEHPLIFELFFRMYRDVTDGLLGKQVYIPNFNALYDKEISILAYIHGLDIDAEKEKKFKEQKVDNITDFLKKKIQKDGSMKKYLEIVSQKFISGATLNYKIMKIEERIKMKLAEHGLAVEFEDKIVGNSVTLYRFEPSVGLKMSKIEAFAKDIEQVVQVSGIRVLAPIPDSGLIGFEVPNAERTFPTLPKPTGTFEIAIGATIMGKTRLFDIRQAPHILVAGTTGAGKSVYLNGLIEQLLKISTTVELHLFDPKEVELFHFEKRPGVIEYHSDPKKIAASLRALVKEMNERYTKMRKKGARNIDNMPGMKYKFIVIDEYADLNMSGGVQVSIQKLAQKGRACGIHLIIATQRASVKVISGDIKINFPTKIVFKMAKKIDSQVMIDEEGAEKLLGKGDMLFVGDHGVERLQGYNL